MTPANNARRRPSEATDIALIKQDIGYIKDEMGKMNILLKANYVSVDQFNALKDRVNLLYKAVFFLLGIIAAGIMGAALKTILK